MHGIACQDAARLGPGLYSRGPPEYTESGIPFEF
jgi:hypothetical protein